MRMHNWFVSGVAAAAVAVAGCGGSSTPPTAKPSGDPVPKAEKPGDQTAANLAKLSPEDKKLAEAQKTCPISGEPLGSMGVPLKLTLKGETVFLCCSACKAEAEKDPDATLKKVAEAKLKGK